MEKSVEPYIMFPVDKELSEMLKKYKGENTDKSLNDYPFRDINWNHISFDQKLSENFMREYQDKIEWENISYTQILSESFIIEFQDKVDWYCISKGQKLSNDFIIEFKDKLDLDLMLEKNKISQ